MFTGVHLQQRLSWNISGAPGHACASNCFNGAQCQSTCYTLSEAVCIAYIGLNVSPTSEVPLNLTDQLHLCQMKFQDEIPPAVRPRQGLARQQVSENKLNQAKAPRRTPTPGTGPAAGLKRGMRRTWVIHIKKNGRTEGLIAPVPRKGGNTI